MVAPHLTVTDTGSGGRLPIPDPTVLTTQASEKAVAALRELIDARITAIEKKLDRVELGIDARPAAIVAEIAHLQKLVEEKFKGVDQQFAGRDTALAAALLAQKTSVEEQNRSNALSTAKSEAAIFKQIDGISALISSAAVATTDRIEAVKELIAAQGVRLTTLESRALAIRDTTSDTREKGRDDRGLVSVVVTAAVGIVSVLITIGVMLVRGPT